MSRVKRTVEELAQRLDIPGEALPGGVKLSIVDMRRVLIENHRGIMSYSEELIEIATAKGRIALRGDGMTLEAMNSGDILIVGKVASVEFG